MGPFDKKELKGPPFSKKSMKGPGFVKMDPVVFPGRVHNYFKELFRSRKTDQ